MWPVTTEYAVGVEYTPDFKDQHEENVKNLINIYVDCMLKQCAFGFIGLNKIYS